MRQTTAMNKIPSSGSSGSSGAPAGGALGSSRAPLAGAARALSLLPLPWYLIHSCRLPFDIYFFYLI